MRQSYTACSMTRWVPCSRLRPCSYQPSCRSLGVLRHCTGALLDPSPVQRGRPATASARLSSAQCAGHSGVQWPLLAGQALLLAAFAGRGSHALLCGGLELSWAASEERSLWLAGDILDALSSLNVLAASGPSEARLVLLAGPLLPAMHPSLLSRATGHVLAAARLGKG